MKWRRWWWVGVLGGFWWLVLAGCGEDQIREEEQLGQARAEPTIQELGLRLAPPGINLAGLSPAEVEQVARGSYLVIGISHCNECHTTPAGYLAGGLEFPLRLQDVQGFTSVFSRNLTPDPDTGLPLTENEFIEAIRTGKDFTDSTAANPQQMSVMPWHLYRFMSRDDLKAMYAFLRRIPPVRNAFRRTFNPPLPLPPVPFPPIGDGDPVHDPNNAERGLRIPQFFSSGPAAATFVTQFNAAVNRLTPEERAKVGRGSYLANPADCNKCHTAGLRGLVPGTVDVNTVAYLGGGVDTSAPPFMLGLFPGGGPLFSSNLTPDPNTGLFLTEEEFIQTLRFGADFRRPGSSLRIERHFPTEFHLTLDDLKAIYAYLRIVPAIRNAVTIVP